MIKNFWTWFRAWFQTLIFPQKALVLMGIGVILFNVLPLIGKLLKFLVDAFIVYGIQLSCMIVPLVLLLNLVCPKAGKEFGKLIRFILDSVLTAVFKALLKALGYKEPKKKDKKDGDKDDDDDS